jgi:hypothetical protein
MRKNTLKLYIRGLIKSGKAEILAFTPKGTLYRVGNRTIRIK